MADQATIEVVRPAAASVAPIGLSGAQVAQRLREFGPNVFAAEAPTRWGSFLAKFWSPIPWLLEAAIILELSLGKYAEAAIIAGLLVFNATLGFIQEGRASAALAALKKRLALTALVRRDGEWVRRPAAELVPGDAIRLPLGALVPADARILSGSVMVDQSMLTGESVPVDATPGSSVYAGSLVRRGQAIAQVTATGSKTYFGRTAELVRVAHAASTEQAAIFGVTRNLALVNAPREDSARLVAALRDMGVRTVMVTGDSAVTGAAIARKVGIEGGICSPEKLPAALGAHEYGVVARVVPEQKFRLVQALQRAGHVVGMCGDGVNDAPALRQAQIGIAVSSATDVAKAAAGMVLTEPGLTGIVSAVREGRVGFQRLLTYAFNMMVKKVEIVLFLAIGLAITGHAVMTPALMVLMLMTNDFLAMSLTTDRAAPAPSPAHWCTANITAAAVLLGMCKLTFSTAVIAYGQRRLGLGARELQTLALVTLVFGAQALLYVVRERQHFWSSKPSKWVLAACLADITIVSFLALSGVLVEPLPWKVLLAVFVAAIGFALILDQVKLLVTSMIKVA